ncbi:3-hydroxybutyryl-CoA dehydrogenase, partial [Aquimarina celericrescens]|nr:3-hydroxybutyryl-CoA dehydrogenase [Aquimarina celericrescens]
TTIDKSLKTLGGFRMGPFELMDFIGNDINYTVTETVFEAFYYDPRYKPSFTQKRLSEAGYLGRKSGKGYYEYNKNGTIIPNEA